MFKCKCRNVSVQVQVWKCQCVSVSVEVSVFKRFSGRTLRNAFGKKTRPLRPLEQVGSDVQSGHSEVCRQFELCSDGTGITEKVIKSSLIFLVGLLLRDALGVREPSRGPTTCLTLRAVAGLRVGGK